VLRSEARLEGQPFHIIEFNEVEFDETLPADMFTMGVPPGRTFESSIPRWWRERSTD
jgi:outer membrane lipoprotein-sorting protein